MDFVLLVVNYACVHSLSVLDAWIDKTDWKNVTQFHILSNWNSEGQGLSSGKELDEIKQCLQFLEV